MVAPVGVLLGDGVLELSVCLVQSWILFADIGRSATFGIGNQQTPGLSLTIAPLRDVVAVEALSLVAFVAGKYRFATCGFFAKLIVAIKGCRTSQYTDNGSYNQTY